MKTKGRRQSSNVHGGGYAESPYETSSASGAVLAHPSLEKLRKTGEKKRFESDLKRVGADVNKRMENAAKSDKLANVANAIRKAQGKGDIKRNPFDTARSK